MSRRYGERGYGRYGDEDERREEGAQRGPREDNYGGRHIRGLGYDDPSRGYSSGREQAPGRDYDYGRDFGYGRDYDTREHASRDYSAREYGRRVHAEGGYAPREYEADDYAAERGGNYRPDYGRGRERERRREHEREHDPNEIRSFDTDYGRTTSRFYGRSGYEFGRDDYDRPNYGPEVTEYRSRRHDERGERRDARDERDERGRGGRGWWDRAADEVLAWFGDDEAARRRRAESGRGGERGAGEGRGSGLYRGRGPKNYRRPDERIREEINDRLTDNDWLDASDVDVTVVNGEVVLSGTVDSRYSKRLAEDIAESVTGVSNVQNNLRVQNYQTGAPAAAPRDAGVAPGDATVTTGDATMTTGDVTMTDTPADAPDAGPSTPNTRASRAGGRG